ncbi:hypothetical protein A0H81_07122 [Grifola frondosa]|uniref:Uncharacterized protein n=1 Tax=Grifola frondosa TaxID=5627 RepID=A0A1C7M804_GRIFR|nr:hypothetical protein A0H81_07122 [Grifola frondosa]
MSDHINLEAQKNCPSLKVFSGWSPQQRAHSYTSMWPHSAPGYFTDAAMSASAQQPARGQHAFQGGRSEAMTPLTYPHVDLSKAATEQVLSQPSQPGLQVHPSTKPAFVTIPAKLSIQEDMPRHPQNEGKSSLRLYVSSRISGYDKQEQLADSDDSMSEADPPHESKSPARGMKGKSRALGRSPRQPRRHFNDPLHGLSLNFGIASQPATSSTDPVSSLGHCAPSAMSYTTPIPTSVAEINERYHRAVDTMPSTHNSIPTPDITQSAPPNLVPTPVPAPQPNTGYNAPSVVPSPRNTCNVPVESQSSTPVLNEHICPPNQTHAPQTTHGGHNPIHATRDDILEMRQDLHNISHQLGRFADMLMTVMLKDSSPKNPNDPGKGSEIKMEVDSDEGSAADVEDTIPSSPMFREPRKARIIPARRSGDSLALARDVQQHARFLMNRENWNSPFDPAFLAAEAEVLAFDPSRGYCCTADHFRPDLGSPPGTPWNKSIAKVFVKSFMEEEIYSCTNSDEVEVAFRTHLKHLRKMLARAGQRENETSLFYRQIEVAANHSELRRHLDILQTLGVDGISSDESDHENGVAQYRVLVKPWRNPMLTPWLRTFDTAYRRDRLNGGNQTTRGAQPHLRLASQKLDYSRPAVPRLPYNAYEVKWLQNLSQFDLESLLPTSGNISSFIPLR